MKWLKILYIQVIIGIMAGIIVGYFFPQFSKTAKLISDTFINMIRMMIAPIIFFTVVLGIAGGANLVKPGLGIDPHRLPANDVSKLANDAATMDWGLFISNIVPQSIFRAFAEGDIIQILFFGVLFSVGLKAMGAAGQGLIISFEK